MAGPFHVNTPLLESASMSRRVGTRVFLKMENCQPTGSFKIRGVGHLLQQLAVGSRGVVCASGGNAGVSGSLRGPEDGLPATVVLPTSTPPPVLDRLRDQGATVRLEGQVWDEANAVALRLAEDGGLIYVPPFDHPLLWEGHAGLVGEAAAALGGERPGAGGGGAVGGGGLLCGVLTGLRQEGWADVPVVAVETQGAHCLHAAIQAGELVTLDAITSWLYEERVLVELACGAALAAVYSGLVGRLQEEGRLPAQLRPLLVVVCGGSGIDRAQLSSLTRKLRT
ncbi:LOW QUALITY PROTEIN: serine dehydratase-like [Menidia menidia]